MLLLEREDELAILRRYIAAASAGQGGALAVWGEPGAGKSTLVEAAYRHTPGLRVLRGGCDPLTTPRPLGPFRDIGRAAGIAALLAGDDLSRAHVCEVVYEALATEPTVLVIEDLHWADAASVELLRFLVRRVGAVPLVLVITCRNEIGPQHSARPLLGDFAAIDGATTVRLSPLSVAGVAQLLAGTPSDAVRVHAVTGGNAFFAVEIAKDPDRPLPASVRDAVLARTVDVAPDDFEVLQLVAAAPDRLDDRLLPALGVDLPTLRRLDETGLLLRSRGGLVFRHELARLALESTVPPGGSTRLHARLLDGLERIEPPDLAALTHHAVAAGAF